MRKLPYTDTSKKSALQSYYDDKGTYTNRVTGGYGDYDYDSIDPYDDMMGYQDPMKYNSGSSYDKGSGLLNQGSSDWTSKNMVGAGLGTTQAILGVANYFDNKKYRKKQMKGIDENIAASMEQRANRRTFIGNTNKSFGA